MKRIVGWVGLLMVLGCMVPGVHATSSPKVTVRLIITNAQGSVVAKMTPDGVPTYSADYRPYGTTQSTPQAGPGYTGHVMDPTSGLVYMQQRYYDPATGRFISPDPVAPAPGNVFNFGRYTYANDNPIRFTDPDGRCVDGFGCGRMVRNYGKWANAHPKEAGKIGRDVGLPAVMVMAAPTVGAVAYVVLSSPSTYLAFSLANRDLSVVDALKAAEERQRAAELVEAERTELKTIEKRFEDILEEAQKKDVPPPPPPPPPKVTEPPPPPKLPSAAPVVQPEAHSNGGAVILRDQS